MCLIFLVIGVVIPESVICDAIEVFTNNGLLYFCLCCCSIFIPKVLGVISQKILCNQVIRFTAGSTVSRPVGASGNHGIVNVWPHCQCSVGGKSPRGSGPCQSADTINTQRRSFLTCQGEGDCNRLILTHLVDVVIHTQFVIRQWSLVIPAIGQNTETFIGKTLVIKTFESPNDRLHEGDVESLVIVFKIDPASLTGDVLFPFTGVTKDGRASFCVERSDTHLFNFFLFGDSQLAHSLELCRETVSVPSKATVHFLSSHGLVAREEVLCISGEQVSVVGKTIGKGWTVVEDPLVTISALFNGGFERVVFLPEGKNLLFYRGERRRGNDLVLLTECVTAGIRHLGLQFVCKTLCQDEISSAVPPELVSVSSPLIHER